MVSRIKSGYVYMKKAHGFSLSGAMNTPFYWLAFLFVVINALFLAKYSMRVSSFWPLVLFAYIVLQYIVIRKVLPVFEGKMIFSGGSKIVKSGAVTAILLMLAIQLYIDPFSVNVDRWSALHYPVSFLLDGEYPYSAPTHLGGRASPFPVWQMLHIPFYICNNVGLSFFVTVALFVWSVKRAYSGSAAWKSLVLVVASVSFWYEAAVRSDLMANMLLLTSLILFVKPYLSLQWIERYYIPVSIAVGLLASTRLLVLLPLAILLFPYYVQMKSYRKVIMPVVAVSVFALTFLPIVLLDWNEFFYGQYPPWLLQSRQGSPVDFLIYIPLIICFSLSWRKSFGRYCFLTTVYLVVFVGVAFVHRMVASDNFDLFGSSYDMTYLSVSLPFAIIGMASATTGEAEGEDRVE